jgi:2-succinyl-5-enolpyruvyl-6-hydroxy-3-cyclohexene-1-carboxylate synthase
MDAYDLFLRQEGLADALAPEVVLRFGATPTSKTLLQYLQRQRRARQVSVLPGGWNDPSLATGEAFEVDATAFCLALLDALRRASSSPAEPDSRWPARWREANAEARGVLARSFPQDGGISEPGVFLHLPDHLPEGTTVFVGNSMPVRDLDSFLPGGRKPLRFLANRGASGIDGVVSTALGVAAVSPGPVVLVIGDLSFYHDMNGLLAVKRHGVRATIVLLNNDGGGIFSLLPQAETEHLEELFAMPHGLDFRHAADMYGLAYRRPATAETFAQALREAVGADVSSVIEVRTSRQANARLHRNVWEAVSQAAGARSEEASAAPGRQP